MKKQIFALIIALGISVILNAGQASAQSTPGIRVDVPFAFSANNKTLPAGTYVVRSAADNRFLWTVEGEQGTSFVSAKNRTATGEDSHLNLRFHRYGAQYFLVSFTTADYEVDLGTSRGEKAFRGSLDDVAKYDEVTIETTVAQKQ